AVDGGELQRRAGLRGRDGLLSLPVCHGWKLTRAPGPFKAAAVRRHPAAVRPPASSPHAAAPPATIPPAAARASTRARRGVRTRAGAPASSDRDGDGSRTVR